MNDDVHRKDRHKEWSLKAFDALTEMYDNIKKGTITLVAGRTSKVVHFQSLNSWATQIFGAILWGHGISKVLFRFSQTQ